MGIARLILSVGALFGTLASAQWDEDPWCHRRAFDPNERPDMTLVEDGLIETHAVKKQSEKVDNVDKGLRGSDANAHRELRMVFMLKMHWEEGYCWQLESKERKWCLKCEGNYCKKNDYLEIDECDVYEDTQWFVYESIDADNREIKLKPWSDQSLCLTRTGDTDLQLEPCSNDYLDDEGRDTQVLVGFKKSGEFELHPKGRRHDCLVNDNHFPRWDENLYAHDCEVSRYFRTSLWEVYAAEKYTDPSDDDAYTADTDDIDENDDDVVTDDINNNDDDNAETYDTNDDDNNKAYDEDADTDDMNENDDDNADTYDTNDDDNKEYYKEDDDDIPSIKDKGSGYCTVDYPCSLCIGDCNHDRECEGELVCYQRTEYESVPFCRGGSSDSSRRDYCTYPN